jgi:NAD(P) transhydrogenase subunit alpha
MSGSIAISGITLLGAIVLAGQTDGLLSIVIAVGAVIFSTINVVGGYLVTHRMLDMFMKKKGSK